VTSMDRSRLIAYLLQIDPVTFSVTQGHFQVATDLALGDKMVLSAGFSSASFGTFEVSEVAPSWVEVRISYPNGIPLETGVVPTASGMIFYSAAKKLVMVASQGKA